MSLPVRALQLERDDVVSLVREAVAANAGVWILVAGTSMAPAIPAHSAVHLAALPTRGLRRGDVVLAIRDSGSPMLHRVRAVTADRVELKGDNYFQPDHLFDRATLIAIADMVLVNGEAIPMRARPHPGAVMRLRQLRQRLRVAVSGWLRGWFGTRRS